MDCAQFEEIVHDLDRPGTQGLAVRDAALIHAESCDRCARLMTEAESLDFSLQLLGTRDVDLEAPPRVEAALLQEFRRHQMEASRKSIPWRLAALGAAAAVLLAFGLLLRREVNPVHRGSSTAQIALSKAVLPTAAPDASAGETDQNQNDDSEYATAYVPLPGASDPATLEGGSIVRVVLSRSALLSLGLPVTDAGAGDRIPADLVLSEDGAPQAIRLVSQTDNDE
jgi:hypothetical protein